jgi:formylmethanofuran dehydrogenase subunit E
MQHDDYFLVWVIRIAFFAFAIYGARFAARKFRREQNDLRLVRDEEQAELFARELPPKPNVVVQSVPRVACSECSELTPMNELEDVENGRLCPACFGKANKTASTYRE